MSTKVILCLICTVGCAFGQIAWNQQFNGDFTYYNDAGYGACGTQINAATQMLVAISYKWFTNPNPNNDPYCTNNVCVRVSYNGNTITVPVKDKCPSCDTYHLDLSQPAFQKLAPLSVGHVYGAVWEFVPC